MTPQEIAAAVLDYREGNTILASYDLQAAINGVPGATSRFGSDQTALKAALVLLW